MGDRTYAELHIHKDSYNKYKKQFDELYNDEVREGDNTTIFVNFEANYGNMDAHQDFCKEHLIEYDLYYDSGSDYEEGSEFGRVKEKKMVIYETHKSNDVVVEFIQNLLKNKNDPQKIVKALEKELKRIGPPFELGAPKSCDTKSVRYVKKINKKSSPK